MDRSPAKGVLLAACASVLRGTVPIAGTVALGGINAAALPSLRLVPAGLFLSSPLSAAPPSRGPPLVAFAGPCLAGNDLSYMGGERGGPATSRVLIRTAPLFLFALGGAVTVSARC